MTSSRNLGVVFAGAFILLSHCAGGRCQSQAESLSAPESTATPAPTQPSDLHGLNFGDADALLRVAVPRTMQNRRQSMTYTYAIDYRNRNFTPHGKQLTDYTAKYEIIFVGDLPYRRQLEEDHKPLTGKEAADESRRYDQAFVERSHMSIEQKRDYLREPRNFDVPLPQLTSLFANRVVGEDSIDGRPAIIVESLPRPDAHPADEEQRRALHKQVKLWIDREDLIVSRIEATLVAEDAAMKPGTVARIDFLRKDGVWLPSQSDVRFEALNGSELVRGETTELNSGFQRFHVDVRLLEPTEPGSGHPAQ